MKKLLLLFAVLLWVAPLEATCILKQSTSIDIRMGPFLDVGDGFTPETGVTIGASDEAEVLKANGAATVAMAGAFGAVTGSDGWYDYTVAAGDVDTVGEVVFVMQDDSVYLPVYVRCQVMEETVYDNNYGSGATGKHAIERADLNADLDVYRASMTVVATSTTTEFVLSWFDNDVIATAATSNTIWCLTADASATDVIGTSGSPTSFTGEATSSDHFYLSDTYDLVDGTIYACRVQATIDAATRTDWFRVARTGHTVSSDLIASGPLDPLMPLDVLGPLARVIGGKHMAFYRKTLFAQEEPFIAHPAIFDESYPNDTIQP